MFSSVAFNPVVDNLSLLRGEDEDFVIRTSRSNRLVMETAPVASKGLIHYLGKVWRKIWRPCTHMKKVWMEMQKVGLEAVERELSLSKKFEKLTLLEKNLREFDKTVIKVHNANRKGLFKNARRVHLGKKQNAVYEKINDLKHGCESLLAPRLNKIAVNQNFQTVDQVVNFLKDGDFKGAGEAVIPGFDFSDDFHRVKLRELSEAAEDLGWKNALNALILAHECGITGIAFGNDLKIECPGSFQELDASNCEDFVRVEGNTGKCIFLCQGPESAVLLTPQERPGLGIKLDAEPQPVQRKLVTELLPLLRRL